MVKHESSENESRCDAIESMMSDPAERNETELQTLIERALRGDQLSFADLYNRYAAGLYRLCYNLLPDRQDAEDVMQESFVYAFRNLGRFDRQKAGFRTWLYTIAVSRCRNTYRRKRFALVDLSYAADVEIPASHHEQPEVALAQQESVRALRIALVQLAPMLREAVVLRYGHSLTYREMAEILDCPQKTAESRVRLAHQKLKDLLTPVGYGLLEELLRI
jgi:RNA polymerase sigma-70 factor (ECF subfamily)